MSLCAQRGMRGGASVRLGPLWSARVLRVDHCAGHSPLDRGGRENWMSYTPSQDESELIDPSGLINHDQLH